MLLKFTLKIVKFIKAIAVRNLRPSSSMQWFLSDIIFRFPVYCFNQHYEQWKGFLERKVERQQFEGKH